MPNITIIPAKNQIVEFCPLILNCNGKDSQLIEYTKKKIANEIPAIKRKILIIGEILFLFFSGIFQPQGVGNTNLHSYCAFIISPLGSYMANRK